MNYWKYRAFDASLCIQIGIIADISNNPDIILLRLRNQGLQGVELSQITKAEHDREIYLQKLRDRATKRPGQTKSPG